MMFCICAVKYHFEEIHLLLRFFLYLSLEWLILRCLLSSSQHLFATEKMIRSISSPDTSSKHGSSWPLNVGYSVGITFSSKVGEIFSELVLFDYATGVLAGTYFPARSS